MWDPARSYQVVSLTAVELDVRLGAYPAERAAPQRVVVDVELYRHAGRYRGGGLDACLNYDRIYRWLHATWPARPHTDLLEDLVEDLVAECLADPRVEACRVRVGKPVVYGGAAAPALEVYRVRDAAGEG